MQRTSSHTLLAGLLVALALLGGLAWLNWRHNARMQETVELVVRTHKVQANLNRLLALIEDIETGARGFVVTGNPAFLEPFESGLKAMVEQRRKVEQLIYDPEQKGNLSALELLMVERTALARRSIDLRQNSGFEAARQEIASGKGKAVMEQIRARFAQMDAKEQALLDQRSAAASRETSKTDLLTATGTGLSFALLITVSGLVLRENRLRERAQAQLDRFFTLSLDMLCIAGVDGYFKRVNPAFNETLGHTAEELLLRPFLDFVHPDDRPATLAEVEKLSRGVPTLQYENRYRCKDGSWKWLSWKVQPLPSEGLLYATARDVTERRQAEEALRNSQQRVRLALEAAQIGDWELDLVTQAARRSLRHDQIFGYAEPLAEWNYPLFLKHVHPEDRARVDQSFHESLAAGRDWHFECRIIRADQKVRWIWARGRAFKDDSGQPTHMIGMVGDITDRKEAEAAIEQLNAELKQHAAQLEAANKELESFSYSISHDLRAPLRHVQGYVEMLGRATEGQLSDKGRRCLEVITAASVEMGQLIDDLLSFSRLGRVELHESCVSLDGLVRDTMQGLEMATQGRNIVWKIPALPSVQGDPTMLKQVLANLLGNAVKYSRQRESAEIEVGCAGQEDGRVILFVKDNGAGFDMRYAHKLFGVFQRLHRAEEFEGTGVGLANVRRIITRHGGRIWAEAALGQGATFYFTLKPSPPK